MGLPGHCADAVAGVVPYAPFWTGCFLSVAHTYIYSLLLAVLLACAPPFAPAPLIRRARERSVPCRKSTALLTLLRPPLNETGAACAANAHARRHE